MELLGGLDGSSGMLLSLREARGENRLQQRQKGRDVALQEERTDIHT